MYKGYWIFFTLCVIFTFCASAQSHKLFKSPIGVEIYTYRDSWHNGVSAILDSIKSLGMTEIEGPNPQIIDPEQFKLLCKKRGIKIPSIGVSYEQLVSDAPKIIELAKSLGANYVMVPSIPYKGTFTIADAKKAVSDFNQQGKILRENGITLCYHDHGFEFGSYGKETLFDYIVQHTNPRFVSFEMDVMWTYHGGADPASLLLRYPNRWKLMHLKDIKKGIPNDFTGGTPIDNDVAVGYGQVNYPEVLKAAKQVGIRHYFIEDESPRHSLQIPLTIDYIKGLKY
jgi:sugar phosphate isomerase/epimerase